MYIGYHIITNGGKILKNSFSGYKAKRLKFYVLLRQFVKSGKRKPISEFLREVRLIFSFVLFIYFIFLGIRFKFCFVKYSMSRQNMWKIVNVEINYIHNMVVQRIPMYDSFALVNTVQVCTWLLNPGDGIVLMRFGAMKRVIMLWCEQARQIYDIRVSYNHNHSITSR